MPSAARQAALAERIRREELRPIEAPGPIQRHGRWLNWLDAFDGGAPAPYKLPWSSESVTPLIVTDVADWVVGSPVVTLLKAGVWDAHFYATINLGANVAMDLSHARAAVRITVNDAPRALALFAPRPVSSVPGVQMRFTGGLTLPPTVLAAGDKLGVEVLPGFGGTVPGAWHIQGSGGFELTFDSKLS